jgi:uncharacterized membrane protein
MPESPGFWAMAGRLHAFLVHFPIALVLGAVAAELLCIVRREGRYLEASRFMVAAAAWMSLFAALAGFLRADGLVFDDAGQAAFAIHRIAGIVTPVLVFLAAALAEGSRRSGSVLELFLYRAVLVMAAAGAMVAGYHGGELVHGPGFFPLW